MQRTPLLTPDEAATYLHVSRLTLAQWRAERTG
ncbi:DNA-binding protein, partial [Bifidobacterium animalis subsp. lactis]